MRWLIGLMTAAVGFAAAALGRDNGAAAQIAELSKLVENLGTLLEQGIEGTGHKQEPLILA